MKIKTRKEDGFLDDENNNNEIILSKGDVIIIRGENENDYIRIVCGIEGRILITTNFTQNMEQYNLVKASQRLLGYPVKYCKCGNERGGLSHIHPLYVPFEVEDEKNISKKIKEEKKDLSMQRYDCFD